MRLLQLGRIGGFANAATADPDAELSSAVHFRNGGHSLAS